jgi:hypothetical protein
MKTLQRLTPTIILLPLLLVSWSLARAQNADSGQTPPPSPPYVAPLTGDFTLVKKFTYLTPPDQNLTEAQKVAQNLLSPPSSKLDQVTMVKNGAVRKDSERFVNGSGRETWGLQDYRFTTYSAYPNNVIINVVNNRIAPGSQNQYQNTPDFPELSWIKASSYQGVQMQQGKKCYAYKDGDQTAWIDVSTHLPVYLESKTLQVTYTFSDPPDEPLQLPQGYAQKLQKFKFTQRGGLQAF